MKRLIFRVVVAVAALGFIGYGYSRYAAYRLHAAALSTPEVPVVLVKDPKQREAAALKYVRVEGVVSNTKQPEIAGVDVDMPSTPIPGSTEREVHDLRDRPAWAEGILVRHIVVPEQLDLFQSRGAGAFYELVDPATGRTAIAQPLAAASSPTSQASADRMALSESALAELVRDTHGDDQERRAAAISRLLPFLDRSMSRADVERWLGKPDDVTSDPNEVCSYYHCTLGVMTVEYEQRDGKFARVGGPHRPE